MLVDTLMNKKAVCGVVPGRRKDVLKIMQERNISTLPIVKKGNKKLLGIVSLNDLLNNPEEEQLALLIDRDPIKLSSNDDIKKACQVFIDKKIRTLPVVKNGKLVGTIGIDDIVKRGVFKLSINEPCKKYTKTKLASIWQETPLNVVLKIMGHLKSLSAVILNDHGKISGMIDMEDLINAGEVINEMKKKDMTVSGEDEWEWETTSTLYVGMRTLKLPKKPVKEYMTKEVITVSPDESITLCAKKMRKYNIEQMPVIDDGDRVVGIIRDYDILKALIDG
ncbi:MAG: CBS domain-containing protein [Euryarchaeota archaeon]|nr:CBS domain-containing protein [Euryarchaeota archaeon]